MIHFVVALAPEAQPIVERFGLALQGGAFRWYGSERAALVVSGIGKAASAAATAYLHARTGERPDGVWLNVGVAGRGVAEVGGSVLAHTVRDAGSGKRWYPTHVGGPAIPRAEVLTVESSESDFATDAAYDMEASGFYPTALRFSPAELVHTFKIVSDTRERPWSDSTAPAVRNLVADALDLLEPFCAHLDELSRDLPAPSPELSGFESRVRLTTSERRKLARLLERLRVLAPESTPTFSAWKVASSSDELLHAVEREVRRLARERPL